MTFPYPKPRFPFLNGHLHTILPTFRTDISVFPDKTTFIPTPDDDEIEVDIYISSVEKSPLVVVLHGLEGSSKRYYVQDIIHEAEKAHFNILAMNFRSCGSKMNKARRFYHSGETSDLETVLSWANDHLSFTSLFLVGFSLGANVVQRYLIESDSTSVKSAVCISAPYNLSVCSSAMSKGFNKVYDRRFIHYLRPKLEAKRILYPDLPEFTGTTLYDFDNQITSVLHGFKNAEDYYAKCSTDAEISSISTPMLLIHSKADPICPFEALPYETVSKMSSVHLCITETGGHVGWVTRPRNWLPSVVLSYLNTFK